MTPSSGSGEAVDKMLGFAGGIIAVILLFSISGPAHAYLDPVTGLFIAQGVGAAILGVIAAVKRLRNRVFGFFRRGKSAVVDSAGDR